MPHNKLAPRTSAFLLFKSSKGLRLRKHLSAYRFANLVLGTVRRGNAVPYPILYQHAIRYGKARGLAQGLPM